MLGAPASGVRGFEVDVPGQRRIADQIALGVRGKNHRPDVFAEVVAIDEERTAARCEDLVAEPGQVHLIPLGPAHGRGHMGVGSFNGSDGAAEKVAIAFGARAFGDVTRENLSQAHWASLYGDADRDGGTRTSSTRSRSGNIRTQMTRKTRIAAVQPTALRHGQSARFANRGWRIGTRMTRRPRISAVRPAALRAAPARSAGARSDAILPDSHQRKESRPAIGRPAVIWRAGCRNGTRHLHSPTVPRIQVPLIR